MSTEIAVIDSKLAAISQKLDETKLQSEEKIDEFINSGREKIDSWMLAQKEQTRLEAPVSMWNDRAVAHINNSTSSRKYAIIFGILGIILFPIISIIGYKSSKSIFEDAIISNVVIDSSINGLVLSPTFHFQLIFSFAVTAIWMTMYIWAMRIIIRQYFSELALATDASGRAAMTQAYLGLIEEGAASEGERAIVMGALFQPVTGSIGTDDGPPLLSLPSLMAAIASGKGAS